MRTTILLIFVVGIASCSNSPVIDSISSNSKNYVSQFYGVYKYNNYQTDKDLGTGVGVFYNLKVFKNICKIDMEGYQTDKQLRCYIKLADNNSIEIYDIEKIRNLVQFEKLMKMNFR
ncbi:MULTISPECIES: DUF5991 domain-containing protein [unclassified Psychrobacter]|uniref:DUF5991 domain-containing protein n=1 Tax=unclassified Psychrobacter TaxID=196806 RepID=UPI00071E9641|nr:MULTISPECIES: DUF5991 domain-containing protein [unclassified Psychrobacter]OLF38097.1 hypothetical protein BTV98_04425 [Psychrobacter sp. Cmf 22.2]